MQTIWWKMFVHTTENGGMCTIRASNTFNCVTNGKTHDVICTMHPHDEAKLDTGILSAAAAATMKQKLLPADT